MKELELILRNCAKDTFRKSVDFSTKAEEAAFSFISHPITFKLAKIKAAELILLAGAYILWPEETMRTACYMEEFAVRNAAPIAVYVTSMPQEIMASWKNNPWLHYIL